MSLDDYVSRFYLGLSNRIEAKTETSRYNQSLYVSLLSSFFFINDALFNFVTIPFPDHKISSYVSLGADVIALLVIDKTNELYFRIRLGKLMEEYGYKDKFAESLKSLFGYVRLPVLAGSLAFLGYAAKDLPEIDAHNVLNVIHNAFVGFGLLFYASSLYLHDNEPRNRDKDSFLRRLYDRIRSTVFVQEPQHACSNYLANDS